MRGARLLTLLGGKRRSIRDPLLSLASWEALAGTAALADGGGVQASALGDWGGNLIVNGEFTEDTDGWAAGSDAALTREDAAALGIAPSGGADEYVIKVRNTGTAFAKANGIFLAIPGSTVQGRVRTYRPSTNTEPEAAQLQILTPYSRPTVSDEWQSLVVSAIATGSIHYIVLYCRGSTDGDFVYYDKVEIYRQNAPLRYRRWNRPNATWFPTVQMPASGVVPWSWFIRMSDAANYWEVRVLPGTDGNDLSLIEVNAGVETVRASADVDWTVGGEDRLRIDARGTTIVVQHMKDGQATWSDGLSYATATFNQTAPYCGTMQWGADAAGPYMTALEVRA